MRRIRKARLSDLPRLPEIEASAGILFRGLDLVLPGGATLPVTFAEACREGRLLVATDERDAPVGFALLTLVDGQVHLEELDVHPEHGRQGLGRALVEATFDWARARGYRAVTLATFREVPFNAPFYRKLGFVEPEDGELGPGLQRLRLRERALGFDLAQRCILRRSLA